jgi:hypothetical protein
MHQKTSKDQSNLAYTSACALFVDSNMLASIHASPNQFNIKKEILFSKITWRRGPHQQQLIGEVVGDRSTERWPLAVAPVDSSSAAGEEKRHEIVQQRSNSR